MEDVVTVSRAVDYPFYFFCFFFYFFFRVAQAFKRRFCSGICYFSVLFQLPILLRFWGQICFKGAIMLVKYATLWLFTLPLSPWNLYGLFTYHYWGSIHSAFFFCFFFGVAQAFKRRFCSGKCYVLVFLLPIMLRFWGPNMLQRGNYAREICYFVVVHAPLFPLQPVCIIYFSFRAYLLSP